MNKITLKDVLKIKYNRFILQTLMALSLPIFIMSLSSNSYFLMLRFLLLLLLSFILEVAIFLIRKHKILELSSLFNAVFALLFLPLQAGFVCSLLVIILILFFKYAQGGFGKNMFNSGILSILALFLIFPQNFAFTQVSETVLIFLSFLAFSAVVLVLFNYKFLAWQSILGFVLGSLGYYLLSIIFRFNLDFEFLSSAFAQGGFLIFGIILLFSEPNLGLKNNFLSFLIGMSAAIFTNIFSSFLPLNMAFLIAYLVIVFWKNLLHRI